MSGNGHEGRRAREAREHRLRLAQAAAIKAAAALAEPLTTENVASALLYACLAVHRIAEADAEGAAADEALRVLDAVRTRAPA